MDQALSQVIDYHLSDRPADELMAAYRAICGLVVLRTTLVQAIPRVHRPADVVNRRAARNWLRGNVGTITLEQACEALDMEKDAVLEAIGRYAESQSDEAIRSKRRPKSHVVFGRTYHDSGRQDSPSS